MKTYRISPPRNRNTKPSRCVSDGHDLNFFQPYADFGLFDA
jgi:hypothetical protein